MSENHRYYWLKLQETFFEDDTIDFIESQENGERYVLFYLKLCLKALKNEGKLIRYVGELLMPYDDVGLSKLTKTDVDTVRSALILFAKIGLIKKLESGEIYLTQLNELIGTETSAAQRKRKQRINEKARLSLECDNVTDMSHDSHTDIDIELDKEQDINNSEQDNSDFPEYDDSDFPEDTSSANADSVKKERNYPYSIFYKLHTKLYNELVEQGKIQNKPIDYNYKVLGSLFKKLLSNPYFTEEKILQGIQNGVNDEACIKKVCDLNKNKIHIVNDSLKTYLSNKVFNKCDFIKLNWLIPTDNNLLYYSPKPTIERFKGPYIKEIWIKSIISNLTYGIHSPKISPINNVSCDNEGNQIIYKNWDLGYVYPINIKKAYIIHFRYRSTEEFINKYKKDLYNWRGNYTENRLKALLKLYLTQNKITLEKLYFLERELKVNLSIYKHKLSANNQIN